MGTDEKNYLIKKGFLREDSHGNLYGEPPTLIDDTIAEENEETEAETQGRPGGQVLFHIGDVSVRSVRFHNLTSQSQSVMGSPGPGQGQGRTSTHENGNYEVEEETEFLLSASTLLTRYSEIEKEKENDEDDEDKENRNQNEDIEGVKVEMEVEVGEMETEMVYSTPETSFCPTTPPQQELSDREPAVDPESEKELSFYDSFDSPLSRSHRSHPSHPQPQLQPLGNKSTDLDPESGEELDDTISQMERLLALADAQECEENERLELEKEQLVVPFLLSNIQEARDTDKEGGRGPLEFSSPPRATTTPNEPEFKTPYAKTRSGKKVVRPPTPGAALPSSPGSGSGTSGCPCPRPRRESPRKIISPRSPSNPLALALALSSTPKSTAKHCVNSMVASPVSTIHGSPTPWGKGRAAGVGAGVGVVKKTLNLKGIPLPIHPVGTTGTGSGNGITCGIKTPLGSLLGLGPRRGCKLLGGGGGGGIPVGVSSPVARYIYSTPTPPMVKRAIKTECQSAPPEKRSQRQFHLGRGQIGGGGLGAGAGLSSIPRAIPSGSGIPNLGGAIRDCGRMTEMGDSQRLNSLNSNSMSMSRDGFGFKRMSEKQIKPIKYQGSSQLTCPTRTVTVNCDQDPGTPISTPKVYVVKSRVGVEEPFIAQRHTGARNANTNESIVQHSSVDKKFVPTRVLVPPKK